MKKNVIILTIAVIASIADWTATIAFAQNPFELIMQQTKMQQDFFDQTNRQIQESRQRNTRRYRQASGDWNSSDAEAAGKLDRMSRAANPEAYRQMHKKAMANQNRTFVESQKAMNEFRIAVEQRTRQSREFADRTRWYVSDRTTEMIRGHQRFVNPTTGQITTLPIYQPYQPRTNPTGNIFLQNGMGQYRSFVPGGDSSTQLNPYHGW